MSRLHRQVTYTILFCIPLLAVWLIPASHPFEGLSKYLPLHTALEGFSITVCALIFAIFWNSYSNKRPGNVLILSCALLSVGFIDFAHLLSYPGMPDFVTPSSPEKAINFWLFGRLISALAILLVAVKSWQPLQQDSNRYLLLIAALITTLIIYWICLYQADRLPRSFVTGSGLTPFKIYSEYLIMAIFGLSALIFFHQTHIKGMKNTAYFFIAAVLAVISELCFTFYSSVSDIYNLLGHIYKAGCFIALYQAVFVLSVKDPFNRVKQAETIANSRLLDLQESRRQLETAGREWNAAFDAVKNPIFIVDNQFRVIRANESYIQHANKKLSDIIDTPYWQIFPKLAGPSIAASSLIEQQDSLEQKEIIELDNQQCFDLRTYKVADDNGAFKFAIHVMDDITESRRFAEEISYQASHDMLTGLINRREFERHLQEVVRSSHSSDTTHVLCYLDLDQFKVVNDSSGHVAGDELLRQLAFLLKKQLRQHDTLARIGGDEFAILLEHCSLEKAEAIANEIRELIAEFRFHWQKQIFTIGASLGLTEITSRTQNSTEALKQADMACYAAKDAGRNRVHLFKADDEQLALKQGEIFWANEIKSALCDNRLELFAQTIKPLKSSPYDCGYEILLRLRSKDGELIAPGRFLPAAERYNLSFRIDRWVVDNAFLWIHKNLQKIGHIEFFSINLSGQSIGDEALLNHIINLTNEFKLPTSRIKFEITETAAIANLNAAYRFIQTLKKHGYSFALDDFGSGLSSFAYLKNLPVDYLKIDGMFVKDIADDLIDEAMTRSINDIGQVMGMKTIAEFVESQVIEERLIAIGVDYAQGYHVSKPAPIDSLINPVPEQIE
ncbi:MASE3 domain-containing protein [Amphritea sp. HPY]|uniref:MASE3 domain-containing protein n=1 Tax=Amphritea sp. HPY TaxID=3421652 RepID=UPI003D7C74E9